MEVNEKLLVSDKDFFSLLQKSLLAEINQSTNEKFSIENIKKGFTYKKIMKNKIGQKSDVKITICEFTSNKHYKASLENYMGITFVEYLIEPIDSNSIYVKYSENFETKSKVKDLNQKFLEFLLFKRKAKNRAIKLLHSMESYINNN